MSEPALELSGATKRYGDGDLLALDRLDLSVPAGTIFALVGPNGAGKTTTIGLLTGLIAPTAGRARIFGWDVATEPLAAKALLGFVPDRPWLWPKWTPRETLRFVGAVFGGRGAALETRIAEELAAFGIDDDADRRNETLSHGTRQKVALAQAFLHAPRLLVLDEPMVGLDPFAQRRLVERVRSLAASGAGVLFTTHQLALAEETADEAGLLVSGRLVGRGDPRAFVSDGGRVRRLTEAFFETGERRGAGAPSS